MEIKKEEGKEAVNMFVVVVLFLFFPRVGGGEIDNSVKKVNVKGVLRKGRMARRGRRGVNEK